MVSREDTDEIVIWKEHGRREGRKYLLVCMDPDDRHVYPLYTDDDVGKVDSRHPIVETIQLGGIGE